MADSSPFVFKRLHCGATLHQQKITGMKRTLLLAALCLAILAGCASRHAATRPNTSNVIMLDQSILLAY
jgi:type IV pilus biogenesis protein CpaD/CtpE